LFAMFHSLYSKFVGQRELADNLRRS